MNLKITRITRITWNTRITSQWKFYVEMTIMVISSSLRLAIIAILGDFVRTIIFLSKKKTITLISTQVSSLLWSKQYTGKSEMSFNLGLKTIEKNVIKQNSLQVYQNVCLPSDKFNRHEKFTLTEQINDINITTRRVQCWTELSKSLENQYFLCTYFPEIHIQNGHQTPTSQLMPDVKFVS